MTATDTNRSNATRDPSTTPRQARPERRGQVLRETKPSPKTSEMWAMVAGIVALAVIYLVTDNDSLTLWRTCLLATIVGAAYIVSRGIAKAGSHDDGGRAVDYDYDRR
jgi:hypothetical protein